MLLSWTRVIIDYKKRIPARVVSMTRKKIPVTAGVRGKEWACPTLSELRKVNLDRSSFRGGFSVVWCRQTLTPVTLRKMPTARSSFCTTMTRGWPARRPPPCASAGLKTSSCFPEVSGLYSASDWTPNPSTPPLSPFSCPRSEFRILEGEKTNAGCKGSGVL